MTGKDPEFPPRMVRGRRLPDQGEDNPVRVPEREWEAHNRRKDTAEGHATGEEPVE